MCHIRSGQFLCAASGLDVVAERIRTICCICSAVLIEAQVHTGLDAVSLGKVASGLALQHKPVAQEGDVNDATVGTTPGIIYWAVET
jgi:hypothetical protein